jgi:hypothetical protein
VERIREMKTMNANRNWAKMVKQLDYEKTVQFGVPLDGTLGWMQRQQRKLVYLIDHCGGSYNLMPIFNADDNRCVVIRYACKSDSWLACSAQSSSIERQLIGDALSALFSGMAAWASDDSETGVSEAITTFLRVKRPSRTTVCYLDGVNCQIHRNTADAMAAFNEQLGAMMKRRS